MQKLNKSYLGFPLVFILLLSFTCYSQVKLPRLISDGMVLQRDAEVKVWGWAAKQERVTIQFIDSVYQTIADDSGNWAVKLSNLKTGGPYTMIINASNTIIVKDVLVGDVWVCSGQSNMELPVSRVAWVYPEEIAQCKNNLIRHFLVPQTYDFISPHKDFNEASWIAVSPESVMDFSAVAYFFAKNLYERYNVPIGLINTSLGGSPAEAWMSEEALKQFPVHYEEMLRFKDTALVNQIIYSDKVREKVWYKQLNRLDEGYKDKNNLWYKPSYKITADWKTIQVPSLWTGTELEKINGVVWYRKTFNVNVPEFEKEPSTLVLGSIVDADSVFVNGVFVGTTSYKYPPRRYTIPKGILNKGENTITVRLISSREVGGFLPDKLYSIICGTDSINLAGEWNYRLGGIMKPLASETFIRYKPGGLYNAMLAPMLNYSIKGVIWYQGESNTGRSMEYRELFPAMIQNWRNDWHEGDFPFLYVQLANFMESKAQPSESGWALLRESQLKTLSVPNSGMAVTIDIGEWNDVHPVNKKDVGYRLALAAEKIAYGDTDIVFSGPVYQSMSIEGNKIIVSFTNIGSGLLVKGEGDLKEFAIAGADKQFMWAQAKIENNKVVIWNDQVSNPVAVRYAWADNPDGANLFNIEELPASPFRTDDW